VKSPDHSGALRAVVLAAVMLTLSAAFWAGSAVTGRMAAGTIPPVALSFWRWVLAFVMFVVLAGPSLWRERHAALAAWRPLLVLSLTGIAGFSILFFEGLQYSTAINASLFDALGPMLTLALAAIVLRAPASAREMCGVVLGIAGTVLIIFRGQLALLLELQVNIGDVFLIASMVVWAGYTVALRRFPLPLDPLVVMAVLSGLGLPIILPFYALELARGETFEITTKTAGIILYAGVFASALAYLCWNRGVAVVGPAKAALAQYLVPVFGVVLAILVLGEALEWFHVAGMILIFAGIGMATIPWPRRR
jgi:drug/metabolite transporter (DMT)-like permease